MSEVDPDPHEPGEGRRTVELGGHDVPEADDPTMGGKHGRIGDAPSIASDEPGLGTFPVGGNPVTDDPDATSGA